MTPIVVFCKNPVPNRIHKLWNTFSIKYFKVRLVRVLYTDAKYNIETSKILIPLSKKYNSSITTINTLEELYMSFEKYGFGELEDAKNNDIIKCVERYVSMSDQEFMKTIPQLDLYILAKVRNMIDKLRVFANKHGVPSQNIFFYSVGDGCTDGTNNLSGSTFEQAYCQMRKHVLSNQKNCFVIHLEPDEDLILNSRIVLSGDILFGRYEGDGGMFPLIFNVRTFDNLYQEKYYRKVLYCDENILNNVTVVFYGGAIKRKRKKQPDDVQILGSVSKIKALQAIMSIANNKETMNILNESYVKDICDEENIVIL